MEYITIDNIDNFVGKTVHCKPVLWHYYPLQISKKNDKYFYADRNGVMMEFAPEQKIAYTDVSKGFSLDDWKVYCNECVFLEERPTFAETQIDSGIYYKTGTRYCCSKNYKRFSLNSTLDQIGFSYCYNGIRKDD